MPTGLDVAYPRSPRICVAYGWSVCQCDRSHSFNHGLHTPAKTLVMSRTRIPAKGKVGESIAAVILITR